MLGKGHGGLCKAPTGEERRKWKAKRREIEMRSSLLILDLKDGKLQDSGKQEGGKTFHQLHVLEMNDDFWDKLRGLGNETWNGCE